MSEQDRSVAANSPIDIELVKYVLHNHQNLDLNKFYADKAAKTAASLAPTSYDPSATSQSAAMAGTSGDVEATIERKDHTEADATENTISETEPSEPMDAQSSLQAPSEASIRLSELKDKHPLEWTTFCDIVGSSDPTMQRPLQRGRPAPVERILCQMDAGISLASLNRMETEDPSKFDEYQAWRNGMEDKSRDDLVKFEAWIECQSFREIAIPITRAAQAGIGELTIVNSSGELETFQIGSKKASHR